MLLERLSYRSPAVTGHTPGRIASAPPAPNVESEPTESVVLSAGPVSKGGAGGALKTLLGWGSALGMACLNGIAGVGLLLLAPRLSQKKEQEYSQGEAVLKADTGFLERVRTSAF